MINEKFVLVAAALILLMFAASMAKNSGVGAITGDVVATGNAGVITESREIYDVMLLGAAAFILVVWRYNHLIFGGKKEETRGH